MTLHDDLPPLDPDVADLLASMHDEVPPPEVMNRVGARVRATLALPSAPTDPSTPPATTAPAAPAPAVPVPPTPATVVTAGTGAATASTAMLAKVAIVAFVIGAGAGVGGTLLFSHQAPPHTPTSARGALHSVSRDLPPVEPGMGADASASLGLPATPVVAAATGVTDVTAASDTTRDAATPHADSAPTDAGVGPLGSARDRSLADENALITRAQSALARGRAGEALEALSEHQRRFAGGQFVEEREAMSIQALVRLGRMDAARARAERFRARFPASMLRRAVEAAVGSAE